MKDPKLIKRVASMTDRNVRSGEHFTEALLRNIAKLELKTSRELAEFLSEFTLQYETTVSDLWPRTAPNAVLDFLLELVGLPPDPNVLIPVADVFGLLPLRIEEHLRSSKEISNFTCVTFSPRHSDEWFGNILNETEVNPESGILDYLTETESTFDLVISMVPLGDFSSGSTWTFEINDTEISSCDEESMIALSTSLLQEDGTGAFIVTAEFFSNATKPGSILHELDSLNICIKAIISLSEDNFLFGDFYSFLIVIGRGKQEEVFASSFSEDSEWQFKQLRNFRERSSSNSLISGIWMSLAEGSKLLEVETREQILRRSSTGGGSEIRISEILLGEIVLASSIEDFPSKYGSFVFIPRFQPDPAITSPDDAESDSSAYYVLETDPKKIDSKFLVTFLNASGITSLISRLWWALCRDRFDPAELAETMICLPSADIRDELRDQIHLIDAQLSRLSLLRQNLITRPDRAPEFKLQLKRMIPEESSLTWIEELPFPLASILWSYQTTPRSEKESFEKLLHFFEGLTQFLAIICLSAFSNNAVIWGDVRARIRDKLDENKLSLHRATFGTWKTIVEILFKQAREMANSKESRDTALEMFRCHSLIAMNELTSKDLVTVISRANKLRNDVTGHGGSVGKALAKEVHAELKRCLEDVRGAFGSTWQSFELIVPESSRYIDPYDVYSVRRITGARVPFPTGEIRIYNQRLHDGRLHLVNRITERGFALLPLVQVIPGPKSDVDACYFFNRVEGKDSMRYVSYHFDQEPTRTVPMSLLDPISLGLLER